jgi:hypothetical protein
MMMLAAAGIRYPLLLAVFNAARVLDTDFDG